MTTKTDLVERWQSGVGAVIRDRIYEELRALWEKPLSSGLKLDLLEGLPFRGEVGNGRDLRGLSIQGVRRLDLTGYDLSYCHLTTILDCKLRAVRLDSASILNGFVGNEVSGASLVRTEFRTCNLSELRGLGC